MVLLPILGKPMVRIHPDAASSPVLKGLYESKRNETKENPVFTTQDAKRTNELSPDGRLS